MTRVPPNDSSHSRELVRVEDGGVGGVEQGQQREWWTWPHS
jgi:hypothetical protein